MYPSRTEHPVEFTDKVLNLSNLCPTVYKHLEYVWSIAGSAFCSICWDIFCSSKRKAVSKSVYIWLETYPNNFKEESDNFMNPTDFI